MNDGRNLPKKLYGDILKTVLQEKGFNYLSCNFVLSEEFIQKNADHIRDDYDWLRILIYQKHIHPQFFDQFKTDMDSETIIVLEYRKSVRRLEVMLNSIN